MKHQWSPPPMFRLHDHRYCVACGVRQELVAGANPDRIPSHRWLPAAGNCKPGAAIRERARRIARWRRTGRST